jgi:hypothetical protein
VLSLAGARGFFGRFSAFFTESRAHSFRQMRHRALFSRRRRSLANISLRCLPLFCRSHPRLPVLSLSLARARSFFCGAGPTRFCASPGGGTCLARKRPMRCGAACLTLEHPSHCPRTRPRWLTSRLSFPQIARGLFLRSGGASFWRR